jgi:hypothetical protein
MYVQLSQMKAAQWLTMSQNSKLIRGRKRLQGRITDHNRIIMLIGSHNFRGIRRLTNLAICRGASPKKIIEMLERAIDKGFQARGGFSQRDYDLAFMIKALGGPRLLYALSQAYGLPSERSTYRHHQASRMLVSLSYPTQSDVSANISTFLGPGAKPRPKPALVLGLMAGNILQFDNIAIDPRIRYDTKRDSMVGISRESEDIEKKVSSIEVLQAAHDAIFTHKTVRRGTEATVVALAPYCETTHYTPVPIVVSPSDKHETGDQLASWLKIVLCKLKTHPDGEAAHGPVWAIGCDGDATNRIACYKICMVQCLSEDSEDDTIVGLYHILSPCIGLDLYTSEDGVTGTCDPKHVFKRECQHEHKFPY